MCPRDRDAASRRRNQIELGDEMRASRQSRPWQRNSPATPENSAAFCSEEFKDSLFRFIYFERALNQTRSVCLRTFLPVMSLWLLSACGFCGLGAPARKRGKGRAYLGRRRSPNRWRVMPNCSWNAAALRKSRSRSTGFGFFAAMMRRFFAVCSKAINS
jgi:hypothetical protein